MVLANLRWFLVSLSCSEVSFFVKGGYRLYVEDDMRCSIIDEYMKLTSEFILFFPLISD